MWLSYKQWLYLPIHEGRWLLPMESWRRVWRVPRKDFGKRTSTRSRDRTWRYCATVCMCVCACMCKYVRACMCVYWTVAMFKWKHHQSIMWPELRNKTNWRIIIHLFKDCFNLSRTWTSTLTKDSFARRFCKKKFCHSKIFLNAATRAWRTMLLLSL